MFIILYNVLKLLQKKKKKNTGTLDKLSNPPTYPFPNLPFRNLKWQLVSVVLVFGTKQLFFF